MEMPLAAVADLLGGRLTDPTRGEVVVGNVRALDAAGPGDLAFLWRPEYAEAARDSLAAAVVTKEEIEGVTCIVVPDAEAAMLALLRQVYEAKHPAPPAGIHPLAIVDLSAELGEGVSVGPGAVIEAGAVIGAGTQIRGRAYVGRNVRMGADCVVHPNATILDHCRLGSRVVVQSGAVIGKDGFGFSQADDGRHVRIPQVGGVEIEDDVEVGALTTIARGALENTVIGRGTKMDDHCHVSHGCRVGKNVLFIGFARIGGGVEVGDHAYLLQDAAVGVGRKIGAGAMVGSGAQVLYEDVLPGQTVLGGPAHPRMLQKRIEVCLPRLPEMHRKLRSLERRVEVLED